MQLMARTAVVLVLAAAVATLWPTLLGLGSYWWEISTYLHGFLIAALSVAWVVHLLANEPPATVRFSLLPFPLLALVLLFWLVAFQAHVNALHQLLAPCILWLCVWCAIGWNNARAYAWPIGWLYFAMPAWDHALPTLQRLCVAVTEGSMQLLGVPTRIIENRVIIPEGTFEIVEGCSGLRYLVVGLAMAYVCRWLFAIRGWRVVAYMLACGCLALLVNWIRIDVIVYVGHVTQMQGYLVAVEHISFGNLMFLPLLLGVYWLAHRLSPSHGVLLSHQPAVAGAAGTAGGVGGVLGLLVCTWLVPLAARAVPGSHAGLGGLPLSTTGWQGPLPAVAGWKPEFPGATGEAVARYENADGVVANVYVNYFATQSQGRELVGFGNRWIPSQAWTYPWQSQAARWQLAGLPAFSMQVATGPDGHNWLVAHTFRVGAKTVTPSELAAQLAYGAHSILRPTAAGAVAFAIECKPNCQATQQVAVNFWSQLSTQLLATIPGGRE